MRCRGGASPSRRRTGVRDRLSLKWQTPKVCHCEEAKGRRGALSAKREEVPLGCNLAVPGCIVGKLPAKSQLPSRDCHVASLLAMTRQGGYCGAPAPSSGLIPLCKALNERRYRRNRSVRFYRHLVRTGSAFPRLPRRFAPRNDTSGRRSNGNGAAHRIGVTTAASRTGGACPSRRRTGVRDRLSLKWQTPKVCHCEEAKGRRGNLAVPGCIVGKLPAKSQLPSRDCHVASLLAMTRQGGYCGAPAPSSGLIPLCKALNERRYRRNRSVRFYRHLVRTGSAFPRLPRRFAPRNDTSGRRSNGNGAAHRIGGTTAASRTGGACPAPTGPVRIERRPAYDPFFILQYSLFLISSIPLRGMANHMTNRPEIPCLSCKFPQSRRICH